MGGERVGEGGGVGEGEAGVGLQVPPSLVTLLELLLSQEDERVPLLDREPVSSGVSYISSRLSLGGAGGSPEILDEPARREGIVHAR